MDRAVVVVVVVVVTSWTEQGLWNGRASVCLSVPSFRHHEPLQQVCCCGPSGQEILIDCRRKCKWCHIVSLRAKLNRDFFRQSFWGYHSASCAFWCLQPLLTNCQSPTLSIEINQLRFRDFVPTKRLVNFRNLTISKQTESPLASFFLNFVFLF